MALMLALFAAACASTPPAERQVFLPDPPKQTENLTAAEREHKRILAAYGGAYEDPKLEGMISQEVEKLVAASERPDLRYKITILNSPAVNAFALPTGQLYVTRGLIALANDDSELASVLAHEMSHVIARHAAIREDQARQAALVSRVVNDVLSDPQSGALALAKSKIALASFSRAQEFEADGMGVGIAARAGYDPFGAARFLTSMGRNADLKSAHGGHDRQSLDFLSSHPATPDRVKNAQANARQYTAPGGGEHDRNAYLASIDGLVYGEDPSEGFVRGRRFLHPRLGFTFMAPEGFALDNTAPAILGLKDSGDQAMRLDVVRVPAEQSLTDYLASGWIDNVEQNSLQGLTINGFPAATATAKGEQWSFRLYAVRFGSDVYRFIFAAKNRTPEADRAFRQSVESFRRMSLAEINSAKPLRLKIVTVHPGDTVERLAARMAYSDRAVERFRVLNGLDPGQSPKPGDKVKIVTE
ncbi:MAG TPA: M48 family metalloprotease [Xanthobacteraceae bacterium]|jgi:predicted Zn-dependent protease|nr:M48 family metalloprotease [Xanthobacteraceae bacterium]